MKVKVEGLSADQILASDRLQSSSWHFLQSRRWLDYAKRKPAPSSLHYCAFELRYGIEELLFELLVLRNGGLSEKEYRKCIGSADGMKKMLEKHESNYSKLLRFTEIVMEEDTRKEKPKLRYWTLKELFKSWGIASEFLHYCGIHQKTYDDDNWFIRALARLDEVSEKFWKSATETVGVGLMSKKQMQKATVKIWEDYSSESISEKDVRERLRLVRPLSEWEFKHLTSRWR